MKQLISLLFILHFCTAFAQKPSLDYKPLISAVYSADTVRKLSPDHYFITFKKAYFGKVEFTLTSNKSDTVIVKVGEKSINFTLVDSHPPGTVRFFQDTIITKPGRHVYKIAMPAFKPPSWLTKGNYIEMPEHIGNVMPFRYVELKGYKGQINKADVRQVGYFYPFNEGVSKMKSSSAILDSVWAFCKHSMKATSFAGIYVDGDRERRAYEADAYINQLSHYAVDHEYGLARRTIDYLFTRPTWPTEWHYHMHMMLWEDYMYTGDDDFLKKYYDSLAIIIERTPLNPAGLLINNKKNDIIDWPQSERDGYQLGMVNNVPNAFYYHALNVMKDIATVVGKNNDVIRYGKMAQNYKQLFNQTFWNDQTGLYVDAQDSTHSALHSNIFPVVFGLATKEQLKTIVPFIRSKGMAVSVYGAQYLLDALYMVGEDDYALKLMSSTGLRSWDYMMQQGATITWEAWDEQVKPNLDWNHAWGAAPGNIIARRLFGIRPLEPGFKKVLLQPQFGNLKSGDILVPTIKGSVKLTFQNGEGEAVIRMELPVPAQMVLSIEEYESQVSINNKAISAPIAGGQFQLELAAKSYVIKLPKKPGKIINNQ